MSNLREVIEKHYQNFSEGHPERDREIMSPDVVSDVPGAGTIKGIDGFIQFTTGWRAGFPDGSLKALNIVESGDSAISEGLFKGTNSGALASPAGMIPATG